MVEIEITGRQRKWGYLIWKAAQDEDIAALLGNRDSVEVVFMNVDVGAKKIDWKHRRISIGSGRTRSIPESKTFFKLQMPNSNRLDIQCR